MNFDGVVEPSTKGRNYNTTNIDLGILTAYNFVFIIIIMRNLIHTLSTYTYVGVEINNKRWIPLLDVLIGIQATANLIMFSSHLVKFSIFRRTNQNSYVVKSEKNIGAV